MGTKGANTRQRVLDVTQELILAQGYSGTSIDEIILKSDLTKGGFFYHFESKIDLAKKLLHRFLDQEEQLLDDLVARSQSLTEDPLHQFLIFLKLYAETLVKLLGEYQGCLVASYIYESQHFDDEVLEITNIGFKRWRTQVQDQIDSILETHQPKIETNAQELAEMLLSVVEGSLVIARVLQDRQKLGQQILQYRNYIRLIFDAA